MESLILLACPVGMGLMMWFMMKGGQNTGAKSPAAKAPPSLEVLRAERDRIDAELRRHDAAVTASQS